MSSTPEQRAEQLRQIEIEDMRRSLAFGKFAQSTYRGRPAALRATESRARIEQRMRGSRPSTPAEREALLAQMDAEDGRLDRIAEEARHLPGGTGDAFAAASYWEGRTDSAMTRWEAASGALRQAETDAGLYPGSPRYPTDAERATVARAERAWRDCELEYSRCRGHRDRALAELEEIRQPLPPGLW